MFERTRIESASVRRLVADRAWGRAGAVGGVQRSEAYILGAKAGGPLQQRSTKVRLLQMYRPKEETAALSNVLLPVQRVAGVILSADTCSRSSPWALHSARSRTAVGPPPRVCRSVPPDAPLHELQLTLNTCVARAECNEHTASTRHRIQAHRREPTRCVRYKGRSEISLSSFQV